MSGEPEDRYDAIVVGVGPVGALAANLLGREGLRTLAVDASPAPYHLPRAMGIDHEGLRLFQSIGVAEAIAPHVGAYRASEYRDASGAVLRRIVQPPGPHPLAWPPYATFLQPPLEAAARAAMAACPAVTLRLGQRAGLMDASEEGVRVRLEEAGAGLAREVSARYLLACDGASSPVREAMGIRLDDLRFDEPWLVVDVQLDDASHLPEVNIQTCDPARPSTYICGPGNVRRWEVMILPGENPAEMTSEAAIRRLLSPWLRPGEGRIWRASTYRFHALVAERWREGNVFLLGDAAHQTPPFMAQGLNQGLRDAGNLCWKIGEVFHGRAHRALLDSYETERAPATRHAIGMAKTLGLIICERDPAAAAERDRTMLAEMAAGRGEVVRQNLLQQALPDGFLMRDGAGRPVPGAGRVFPQPWVRSGTGYRRMDDVLEARWLLVSRTDRAPEFDVTERARELGVTLAALRRDGSGTTAPQQRLLIERDGLVAAWMDEQGVDAVLVRPDHVVFGSTGDAAPEAALLRALERVLEAGTPARGGNEPPPPRPEAVPAAEA